MFMSPQPPPTQVTPVRSLYTPEQKARRDNTIWTPVQGVLAVFQFAVFLVSLTLVVRCLLTGEGAYIATVSIILKTFTLYTIMVTGSLWEKVVFDKYLFAPAFFWEDVVSFVVIALHTVYMASLFIDFLTLREQLLLILAAYLTYAVNATQFVLKLRAARLQDAQQQASAPVQSKEEAQVRHGNLDFSSQGAAQ